ncbi:hypothetical protein GCM10023093_23500 [Nemorincola caseinilytica]|uniref:Outer membrane lipoprotein-sorting protein n=1 Tax=Nemorincola caseinilytica TaxID=2054315 RepID=A0ABP8NHK5_9BACT
MKRTTISLAAALLFAASANVAIAQTGDEIITKHIDAIGGEKNWNNVKSMKMIGSTSIQGMEVGMDITIVDQKAMRTNISLMGMEGYVIMTDKEGWMYMPMQPGMDKVTPMPEEQVKSAKGNFSIKSAVMADRTKIAKATYSGKDTLDGVACHKVLVADKEGNEQTAYFDMSTYYLVRAERKVKQKEEEQEVAISYSNFQKQPEGVVIAMTQSNPMLGGDITFKKVEINKPIPADYFQPSEPKKAEEGKK